MSVKRAQAIVNEVEDRMGISLVSYQTNELEWLKDQLENLLELEVETEELEDPDDLNFDDETAYHRGRNLLDDEGDEDY